MAKQKKTNNKKEIGNQDYDGVLQEIEKEFGDGSIVRGRGVFKKVDKFPSGVMSIDIATGCGGIPQGRIIEFFGQESSGKTTTCLQIIAACQKHYFQKKERYGEVVFIDAEHALDIDWAEKCGVNTELLAISQPDSGEKALKMAEKFAHSGKVDLIVIDSVAALTPEAEINGEIGDTHIGLQARMMSQACRMLNNACSKSNTTIIFINQIREKIGVLFGSPNVTPGGKALKFYASVRMEINKGSSLKENDITVGFRPKLKIIKNKVGPPFTSAEYDICVGNPIRPVFGVDCMSSLLNVATDSDICGGKKVIEQRGSNYYYEGEKLGNGAGKACETLRNNPELANKICNEIYSVMFGDVDNTEIEPDSIDDEIIDSDDD